MPFYEYQCSSCGHEEEVLQKISDKPLKKCPACSKLTLKKKVSAAAFRLKGGGWYETDFKSGNKKNLDKTDTGKTNAAKPAGSAAAGKSAAAKSASGASTSSKKQVK